LHNGFTGIGREAMAIYLSMFETKIGGVGDIKAPFKMFFLNN
jgi:hypothetical protein